MTELLRADHLTRHFKIGGTLARGTLHAVDDVSFAHRRAGDRRARRRERQRQVDRGPAARPGVPADRRHGHLLRRRGRGKPLSALRSRRDALRYSGQVPMVFQDPFSSLNPVFRVSHGVLRALKLHRPELSAAERRAEAARVFDVVGLGAGMLGRYPHELSGGQRQRVGFAQALATRPRLILADEPVSMLDTSIRIGLLNLMAKLRDEEGVSILYITHDIASARYVADRLIVMYAGQIAESGPIEDVLAAPRHPYTQLLLSAVPDPKAPPPSLEAMAAAAGERGEPPKVIDPRPGCRFQPRCPVAVDACATVTPELLPLGSRRGGVPRRPVRRGSEGVLVKLAVIGGGSTYTPELADGLGRLAPQVTELVLVDPDEARLAAVGPVSARIMRGARAPGGRPVDHRRRRRARRRRPRCSSSSGSAGRRRGTGTRRGRSTSAAWGRRRPGRAGSPRRCAPCRWCSRSPSSPGGGPRRARGSSTSPTRSASSPGRCSTRGTARSGCATWRSGCSGTSPRCSASHRSRCHWTTWG